jgi:hypothetical protein
VFGPAFEIARTGRAQRTVDPKAWWATEPAEGLSFPSELVGLLLAPEDRVSEIVSRRLEVPQLRLRDAQRTYQRTRGQVQHATILVDLATTLVSPGRCLLDRLLGSGAAVGMWGQVDRWDRGRQGRVCRVFPGRGTPSG